MYVIAFLYKNNEVLLIRRLNRGFGNGLYSLVGGKVEHNETALHAIKREVYEEVDLDIPASSFKLIHVLHRKGTLAPFVSLCFKADISNLPDPKNKEPEKHDDVRFFQLNNLPENIVPAHRQVIESIEKNINYSEHGW